MSFVLQYRRLFGVTFQDETSGAWLPGFSFRPSPETWRRLDNHGLLFREREAGFEVYFSTNPLAPSPLMSPIRARTQFTFEVHHSDPSFFEAYLPAPSPDAGPQYYLDNLDPAGDLPASPPPVLSVGTFVETSDSVRVYPPVFTASVALGAPPLPTRFRVKDKFDPTVTVLDVPITAPAGAGMGTARLDLSAHPAGPYLLQTDVAGAKAETIYVDESVAAHRVFAVLDLYWATAQDTVPSGGIAYAVRFRKR